jgi:preprotein translocase subunit SecG
MGRLFAGTWSPRQLKFVPMLLGILLATVIVVCIALVGVILLQRSEGGVLGMSGGGPGNFMSARGTGDLLTRTTQILAAIFFGLCLVMTLVTGHLRRETSIASKLKDLSIAPPPVSSQAPASAAPNPLAPAAPIRAPAPAAPANEGLNLFGPASAPAPRVQPAPSPVLKPLAAPKPAPAAKTAEAAPAATPKPKPVKRPAPAAKADSAAPAPAPEPSAAPAAPAAPPAGQ